MNVAGDRAFKSLATGLVTGAALAVAAGFWSGRERPRVTREPDISALRSSLEQTAAAALSPAPVTAAVLRLSVSEAQMDAEANRVSETGREFGGTAVPLREGNATRVIIKLPAGSLRPFAEKIDAAQAGSLKPAGDESELIEVFLEPAGE